MKIISWNVNGIRSANKKGFLESIRKINADIVCLQEMKSQEETLPSELRTPDGFRAYFNFASKKGYAGVAVYTKKKPLKVEYTVGLKRFDEEGRFLKLEFEDFVLFNVYLPHGGRKKDDLAYKLRSYEIILDSMKKVRNKKVVFAGDFNIAHTDIDLARPKNNRNNIMFTEEERQVLDRLIGLNFIDTFRKFNTLSGNYTWWPYAFDARERNVRWRIDYIFVSKKLSVRLKKAFILKKVMGSDHCPVGIELSAES